MIGLTEDLLDTYRFVLEHLGIPISDVQNRVHGSTRTHPQPYSSHRSGSGHGGSAHDDPPTNHSFAPERHIHTIDPLASVTGQDQSSDVGLNDVDLSLSTTGWMDLLTRDDSTSMPSHLHSPLGSSLLGHVPVTSHGDNIDVEMDLDAMQQHVDALVDTIDARQSEYYQMPPSTQVNFFCSS